MGINSQVVRYNYRSRRYSDNLILHVFRYLSAVTGLSFVADDSEPDIYGNDNDQPPLSARIIITADDAPAAPKTGPGPRGKTVGYNPIDLIAGRLSLSAKRGPHFPIPHSPDTPERLLSRAVRDLVELMAESGLIPGGRRAISLWPDGHEFGVALTHDVDILRRSIPGGARLLINRRLPGGWGGLLDSIRSTLGLARNPYDDFEQWMRLEKERGLESTFFVFCGKRRHRFDPVYKLNMLERAFGEIRKSGFDIALHTSIGCFAGDGIAEAKSDLENSSSMPIDGLRPHYLSASFPEYWRAASDSGLRYSSSLGFDDRIGFYNGMDLPFIPFDIGRDEAIDIVEYPISIMDCGLIGDGRADSAEVADRGLEVIDAAQNSGSLIVMDWHQRTFYNRDYPGWAGLYFKLVERAMALEACFIGLGEFTARLRERFWRQL